MHTYIYIIVAYIFVTHQFIQHGNILPFKNGVTKQHDVRGALERKD